MHIFAAWIVALFSALLAPSALAADACRPLQPIPAGSFLTFALQQSGLLPRVEGELTQDVTLSEDPTAFGLVGAVKSVVLAAAVPVNPQWIGSGALVGERAKLIFDTDGDGVSIVLYKDKRYLVPVIDGTARSGNGAPLEVAPELGAPRSLTVLPRSRVLLGEGNTVVLTKGSRIAWELAGEAPLRFMLLRPATFELTFGEVAPARLTIIKPVRLLAGGLMKVQVTSEGYDFRGRPLTFCFAINPPGATGLYRVSVSGTPVSTTSDSAVYEVRVPPALAKEVFHALPGKVVAAQSSGFELFGRDAVVRVMAQDGDRILVDASQPFVMSNFFMAIAAASMVLLILILLSGLFLRTWRPFEILKRLARHRSQRYSLSNVQVLMWTVIVIFALCFVWVSSGELLVISTGVLTLLGISGTTSVLARAVENYGEAPGTTPALATPTTPAGRGTDKPKPLDLVTSADGEFDLLRFQMLGFTLFAGFYSIYSVLHSEGLPEIPDNLSLLMGISNASYLGGKVADNVATGKAIDRETAAAAKAADEAVAVVDTHTLASTATNDYERGLASADLKKLQFAIGVPQTGLFDDDTRQAVITYKLGHGIVPADGSVSALFVEAVEATTSL